MIILDTHAWFWWLTESPKLSAKAAKAIAIICPEKCFHLNKN